MIVCESVDKDIVRIKASEISPREYDKKVLHLFDTRTRPRKCIEAIWIKMKNITIIVLT